MVPLDRWRAFPCYFQRISKAYFEECRFAFFPHCQPHQQFLHLVVPPDCITSLQQDPLQGRFLQKNSTNSSWSRLVGFKTRDSSWFLGCLVELQPFLLQTRKRKGIAPRYPRSPHWSECSWFERCLTKMDNFSRIQQTHSSTLQSKKWTISWNSLSSRRIR